MRSWLEQTPRLLKVKMRTRVVRRCRAGAPPAKTSAGSRCHLILDSARLVRDLAGLRRLADFHRLRDDIGNRPKLRLTGNDP